MLRGTGTALDVVTILVGPGLGVALRGKLPERTRSTVTDAFGLVTLVIGGLNVADGLGDEAYLRASPAAAARGGPVSWRASSPPRSSSAWARSPSSGRCRVWATASSSSR